MEITKQKLISLLSENYSSDIEEEDLLPQKERSLEAVKKRKPIKDKDGRHIGWMWRKDIEDLNSELITVYFLCSGDIEEFKEKHGDTIKRINDTFVEGWYFTEDACPSAYPEKSKSREYFDLSGMKVDPFISKGYKPTKTFLIKVNGNVVAQTDSEQEAKIAVDNLKLSNPDDSVTYESGLRTKLSQETIKRELNPILKSEFIDNQEFKNLLNLKSIPSITLTDMRYLDKHIDRWTNEKIHLRSHSYNTYGSAKDFLSAVVKRTRGIVVNEMNTDYLARQFNKKYKNWEEERLSEDEYRGNTADPDYEPKYFRRSSYKLDIQGYEQLKLDVSLKMVFDLIGEKMGDGFVWTIKIVNKFGRKKPEDKIIVDGLKEIELLEGGVFDGKAIIVTKTVQLPPNTVFDNKNTIMSNELIVNGLIDTIQEFKQQISNINSKDMIKIANVKRTDIQRVDEQKINKIIKKTMMEMVK